MNRENKGAKQPNIGADKREFFLEKYVEDDSGVFILSSTGGSLLLG